MNEQTSHNCTEPPKLFTIPPCVGTLPNHSSTKEVGLGAGGEALPYPLPGGRRGFSGERNDAKMLSLDCCFSTMVGSREENVKGREGVGVMRRKER